MAGRQSGVWASDEERNPELDLVLERILDVPPERVWAAWRVPAYLTRWFTPGPWKTIDCTIDLWPGGMFRTVMRSPEGQEVPYEGCFLEIVPNRKLVWTGALRPGFRPPRATGAPFLFTAIITMEPDAAGTRYTARVLHADVDGRQKHEAMGFHTGWGKALDQLVALARTM